MWKQRTPSMCCPLEEVPEILGVAKDKGLCLPLQKHGLGVSKSQATEVIQEPVRGTQTSEAALALTEKKEDSQSKGNLSGGFRKQELTVSEEGGLFYTKETAKATSEMKEGKKPCWVLVV